MKNNWTRKIGIVLVSLLLFSACHWSYAARDLKKSFFENESAFQNAADEFIQHSESSFLVRFRLTERDKELYGAGSIVYQAGLAEIVTPGSISEQELQTISQAAFPLFANADIYGIFVADSVVYFIMQEESGVASYLVYETEGKPIQTNFEIQEQIQLKENWYAVTTHD